ELHLGQVLTSFTGADYEFASFPQKMTVKKNQSITKSAVRVYPLATPEQRWGAVMATLPPPEQLEYAKRWLRQDPTDSFFLSLLTHTLKPPEALAFLKTGLDARPIQVEWHRAYQ